MPRKFDSPEAREAFDKAMERDLRPIRREDATELKPNDEQARKVLVELTVAPIDSDDEESTVVVLQAEAEHLIGQAIEHGTIRDALADALFDEGMDITAWQVVKASETEALRTWLRKVYAIAEMAAADAGGSGNVMATEIGKTMVTILDEAKPEALDKEKTLRG